MIDFPIGSQWRKWDLHIHTTASDGEATPQDVVRAAISSGISVVAVTDHHTVASVDEVKRLAQETGGQLSVISGIEFRTELGKSSVHMIGLFPEECKGQPLTSAALHELVLCPLGLSRTAIIAEGRKHLNSTDEDALFKAGMFKVQVNFKDAANLVHKYGGLVSVHNGTKTNGIDDQMRHDGRGIKDVPLSESLGPLKEVLLTQFVDICEVKKADEAAFYLTEFQRPSIVASDAHKISQIGTKPVWIKADPTFKGLRQILFEPNERVKIQDVMPGRKPAYQVLSEIKLNEGGFWKQSILLNQDLVAIIGGRSSGKSTLLECVATKVGCVQCMKVDESATACRKEFVSQHLPSVQYKWADGSDDQNRQVEYLHQNYMIDLVSQPGRVDDLVKELLSSRAEKTELYAKYDQRVIELKTKISSDCTELFSQRARMRALDSSIKEKGGRDGHVREIANLEEKMRELKKLHLNMSDEDSSNFEKLRANESLYVKNIEQIENDRKNLSLLMLKKVEDLRPVFNEKVYSSAVGIELKNKYAEIWNSSYKTWVEFLGTIDARLEKALGDAQRMLTELRAQPLYKKGVGNIAANAQLKDMEERIDNEKIKLGAVDRLLQQEHELEEENRQVRERIIENHLEFYTLSKEFADQMSLHVGELEINGTVLVKESDLQGLLEGRVRRKSEKQQQMVASMIKHESFGADKLAEYLKAIMAEDVQYNQDVDEQFVATEFLSGNWFGVSYQIVYQSDNINVMSPGKRAFVVLMLLLDFSPKECPILIDQPEDSLDNRAIYKDLVGYLRKKKKTRQIILVTHNPNVVVGADAEQVIVANQNGSKNQNCGNVKFSYKTGALENSKPKDENCETVLEAQGIREHVCEILEGGETAFRERENKYGLRDRRI